MGVGFASPPVYLHKSGLRMIRAKGDPLPPLFRALPVTRPVTVTASVTKTPVTKTPVTKTTPRVPKVSVTPLEKAKRAVSEIVNRGGRPKKLNVLTPAQKQAAYRERKRHG